MTATPAHGFTLGLLLGAGRGRRFDPAAPGRKLDVAMTPEAGARRLGEAAYEALAAAVDAVVVATRTADTPLANHARESGAQLVVPEHAELGMGHSLAAAATLSMAYEADVMTLVVALADMPWVRTETIQLLIAESQRSDCIVQPVFADKPGHPVVFPARFAAELARCAGDVGARDVVQRHRDQLRQINVDDSGVLRDVDTPRDLLGTAPS
ncbi:MAG: nucleotidyltransferase family protein [Burkholderiales bacterium]|nr:nucleotidyltransferase family protein [Burkholderiales bacterium]